MMSLVILYLPGHILVAEKGSVYPPLSVQLLVKMKEVGKSLMDFNIMNQSPKE
jgi:hypothetical protein